MFLLTGENHCSNHQHNTKTKNSILLLTKIRMEQIYGNNGKFL